MAGCRGSRASPIAPGHGPVIVDADWLTGSGWPIATRSAKLLHRSIHAICEGRDPGDCITTEYAVALEPIRASVVAR